MTKGLSLTTVGIAVLVAFPARAATAPMVKLADIA